MTPDANSAQDAYSRGQQGSDGLGSVIASALKTLPDLPQDSNDDDDDGKVENHIPGYKNNKISQTWAWVFFCFSWIYLSSLAWARGLNFHFYSWGSTFSS